MLKPLEMNLKLPMQVGDGMISSTENVWAILEAAYNGDLDTIKRLVDECSGLIYAQYNYAPPIHFAVREGHIDLVKYLLINGAHDPTYKIYPFLDSLDTIAKERGHDEITLLLAEYGADSARCKHKGDNGEIYYDHSALQKDFQFAVNHNEYEKVKEMLKAQPSLALDETASWNEGILMMPANRNERPMIELLMSYGARVPDMSKWCQAYYFKHYDMAAYLLNHGMDANHISWQHVMILHDMAQKGDLRKGELLIQHGAFIDPLEEQYQSTPLGLAARWGHVEMVEYLLRKGADVNKAGAPWSTPLAWARAKNHPEVEKKLRDAGAKH